jgi:hypothetical protein
MSDMLQLVGKLLIVFQATRVLSSVTLADKLKHIGQLALSWRAQKSSLHLPRRLKTFELWIR